MNNTQEKMKRGNRCLQEGEYLAVFVRRRSVKDEQGCVCVYVCMCVCLYVVFNTGVHV
jgi:hypothetical protein